MSTARCLDQFQQTHGKAGDREATWISQDRRRITQVKYRFLVGTGVTKKLAAEPMRMIVWDRMRKISPWSISFHPRCVGQQAAGAATDSPLKRLREPWTMCSLWMVERTRP